MKISAINCFLITRQKFFKGLNDINYLKLNDGGSLSLSKFDVGGSFIQKRIKGFIYGERGVWRPGDTLHITCILEDKNRILPSEHPIIFEMYNPFGQLVKKNNKTDKSFKLLCISSGNKARCHYRKLVRESIYWRHKFFKIL